MAEAAKGAGGRGSPQDRLKNLVERWERVRNRAAQFKDLYNVTLPQYADDFEDLVDRREDLRDSVLDLLEKHPDLRQKAVDFGFKADLIPETPHGWEGTRPEQQGGSGAQGEQSGTDGGDRGGREGDRGGGSGGRGGTQRDDGPPPPSNRLLPGVKGKDFYVGILAGGDRLAIYKICVRVKGERSCSDIGVRIEANKLGRYGIGQNEGRRLTQEQAKKIEEIGLAEELQPFFRGEDRNPFEALTRMVVRSYEGTEIIEDDEVRSLVLAQHIFGWSDAEFQNQLRNTKYFNETTEWRRRFDLEMGDADRKALIDETREKVFDALETMYGRQWVEHVKGGMKTAKQWAQDIASGRWGSSGNPDRGFAAWASQQEDRARRIEGTPAFIAQAQELEAQRRYMNRPEDLYEQLRAQAIQALGYRGLPDDATLRHWAKRLAYAQGERGSEGDWANYLRRQKKALFPYLDDDENWMDRAAAYKRIAEEDLGTILSWEDSLLHDFTARDDAGKPIKGEAMSLHDFQMLVRRDDRYDRSAGAVANAQSFANGLVSLFGGPGGGGGLAA